VYTRMHHGCTMCIDAPVPCPSSLKSMSEFKARLLIDVSHGGLGMDEEDS